METKNNLNLIIWAYYLVILILFLLPGLLLENRQIIQTLNSTALGMFFGSIFLAFYSPENSSNHNKLAGAITGVTVILIIYFAINLVGNYYLTKLFFSKDLIIYSFAGFISGLFLSHTTNSGIKKLTIKNHYEIEKN